MPFRVLIVSDVETSWVAILEPEPIETVTVHSPQIVADVDIAKTVDLIIVDLDNAEREFELCRKLRTVFQGALLLSSSRTDAKYQLAAYAAGVDELLVPPFSPTLMRAKIRAWRRRIQIHSPASQESSGADRP